MEVGHIFNKTMPKKSSFSLTCVLGGNGCGHYIIFPSLLGLFWDWSMLIHHQADTWVSECNRWPWGNGQNLEEWNEREFRESRQPRVMLLRAILAPECMINVMTTSFSLTAEAGEMNWQATSCSGFISCVTLSGCLCVCVSEWEKKRQQPSENNSEETEATRDIPILRKQPLAVHNGALLSHCRRDNDLSVLSRHTKGTVPHQGALHTHTHTHTHTHIWKWESWSYSGTVEVVKGGGRGRCVFVCECVCLMSRWKLNVMYLFGVLCVRSLVSAS